MLIHVFTFLLTIALSLCDNTKIHNEMTEDELRLIFQTSRDEVPDYEVVPILHNIQKRSVDSTAVIKLKAFKRNVELYLNPTDELLAGKDTPVWTVIPDKKSKNRLKYNKIKNAFNNIGIPYQDVSTRSAVVLRKNSRGAVQLYGKILSDYVVHPLPHRLSNHLSRRRRSLNTTLQNPIETDYHIIYHSPEKNYNGIKTVKRNRGHLSNLVNNQYEHTIPETIFPELLVICDYSLYSIVGKNNQAAIQYLLSFWNAVDLRYRLMSKPQIRLNLAAFIISIKSGGTPYLENYRRGNREVDADKSLEAMSKYYFNEPRFPFDSYDMAVALTNLDMCNMEGEELCDPTTLGYAYEAGACNRSFVDKNTEAVAIVEDNGGYSAILPATHEVAHLMGSPHDGLLQTTDCPGYDGYIMTPAVTFGEKSFYWSSCTKNAFDEFFKSTDAYCLFNVPRENKLLPRILPGKLKSLDEQCEKVYASRACNYDSSVCSKLECYVQSKDGGYCKAVAAAAEGSFCGKGMHCLSGQCIPVNARFIPGLTTTVKPSELSVANDENNYRFQPWVWKY